MANRSDLRGDARSELGDAGGSVWTDGELNRAIDEVTADFSRVIPQEKIQETTIDYLVVAEFSEPVRGTAVSLVNKPIEFASEAITSDYPSFDGVDDNITITDVTILQDIFDSGGSIEAWIYPKSDGEGNIGHIIGKDQTRWQFRVEAESAGFVKLGFIQVTNGTNGEWRTTAASVPINTWSQVAVTFDNGSTGNDPIFLINGIVETSEEIAIPDDVRTSDVGSDLIIGNNAAGSATFDGSIKDVRMWSDIRTTVEILGNYRTAILGTETGLVGYWKLDDGTGTTVQDSTTNNNDGTLTGATWEGTTSAFVRDTDYILDYANGTITALDSGSIENTDLLSVDYTVARIAIDLSALTDMVIPIKVETQVGAIPQDNSSFFWWNNILWITTSVGKSQSKQGDKTHVRIYYHAEHTAPTDSANGSFPRFLDQVMIKGVVAYALFIKHRKLNLQADTETGLAATALTAIASARTSAEAALNDTTTPLADINTALDKVATHVTEAGTALAKVDVHITTDAETALDAAAAAAALAKTALDKVDTYLTDATDDSVFISLKNILTKSVFADANTALDLVKTFLDEVHTGAGAGILESAESVWTDEVKHILTDATQHNMQDDLETGDDLINTVNLGADAADLWRRYALAARDMAQLWDQKRKDFLIEADKFTAEAITYIQEAHARLAQADRLIAEAEGWSGLAQGFVNEATQRNVASNAYTAEASQRIAMSQGFVNEAQQRIGMAVAFAQEAQVRVTEVQARYGEAEGWFRNIDLIIGQARGDVAVSEQRALVADRILSDARERHIDYWELLRSRVQSARQRSFSSPRQYADGKSERASDSPSILPVS